MKCSDDRVSVQGGSTASDWLREEEQVIEEVRKGVGQGEPFQLWIVLGSTFCTVSFRRR